MRKKSYRTLIAMLVTAILVLGTPSEDRFLRRLNVDYGSIHGTTMSLEQLKQIGTSSFTSYLLWSTYDYSLGDIQVNYVGFAFMTFYQGSNATPLPVQGDKEPISIL
ncbi:MAG: hypothetical protein AAF616_00185 [Bacteroidota bacterium]